MEKDLEGLCNAVTAWYVDSVNDLLVQLVATVVQLQERVMALESTVNYNREIE